MQTTALPLFLVTALCFTACAGPPIGVEPADTPTLNAQYEPNNSSELNGSALSREVQIFPTPGSSVGFFGLCCRAS
jgi:hypothetical protein